MYDSRYVCDYIWFDIEKTNSFRVYNIKKNIYKKIYIINKF